MGEVVTKCGDEEDSKVTRKGYVTVTLSGYKVLFEVEVRGLHNVTTPYAQEEKDMSRCTNSVVQG